MKLPSIVMEQAVQSFSRHPGLGKKTALRLVLHLMKQDPEFIRGFSTNVLRLSDSISYCQRCNNVSDGPLCGICRQESRNQETICVVESLKDLLAIENTQQYNGTYHILGGVISPVDGIGPDALHIDQLIDRIKKNPTRELIMALNPTIEGDTTTFYIAGQLKQQGLDVAVSTIARGISFGGELEYTDEITLARSLATRLPYKDQ